MAISPEKTYQKVNKLREKQGLSVLMWDNRLADAALARAKDMYDSKIWSHDVNGKHAISYINNVQDFDLIGENLARKFSNSDNMVKAWQLSPAHNKNLTQDFTDTGIATYGNVTVQLFGRRPQKKAGTLSIKDLGKETKFEPKSQVKTTTQSTRRKYLRK